MLPIPFHITPEFRQRVEGAFGADGVAWLEKLPEILTTVAGRWSLAIEPPYTLSYNYVAPAKRADGTRVVLKVGCPNPELRTEAEAMTLMSGGVVCNLLEYDPDLGTLLLERVEPGTPLAHLAMVDDDQATRIAVDLLPRLWRPAPENSSFPNVSDWARALPQHRERFGGGTGPLPETLFEEAEECFDWLLTTTTAPQLLHGDFHHGNILAATRARWLVIDPKGIVGDPGYDLGAFLYNPMPGLLEMNAPDRVIRRRVDQLAEGLGMDHARIRAWGIAQAVLSACWSVEAGEDFEHVITCARHLSAMSIRGG